LDKYSRNDIKRIITAAIPEVRSELDPMMDNIKLAELLTPANEEIKLFLTDINGKSLLEAVQYFQYFPFHHATNKHRIKNAILAVYGEKLDEIGNKSLGPAPKVEPKKEEPKSNSQEAKSETDQTTEAPAESAEPAEQSQDSLDPKIEEDAILTLQNYLQKYIFGSRIIPTIKVVGAFEVKNGYILDLEFSSVDQKVKAFAKAVIHNKKLVPPAELEDENGNKVGDFNKETFMSLFSLNNSKNPKETENYTELLDKMVEAPDYTQAGQILDIIKARFGPEVANNAFDSYIRIKTKRSEKILDTPERLNIKIV
jgi:hypothetical protein